MTDEATAWMEDFLAIARRSVPHWEHFDLWDPFDARLRDHHLRFFAAVRLAVGQERPDFVSANLVSADDAEDSTYSVSCLFPHVVLQVTRNQGESFPTVRVASRADLISLEITNAPPQLITSKDGEMGGQFKATATYPEFVLDVPGPGAQGRVYGSVDVLRSLVADLAARSK